MKVLPILLVVVAALILVSNSSNASEKNAVVSNGGSIYVTYSKYQTTLTWVTCGSTQNSAGCFQSGTLGPFGRPCSILESTATVSGKIISRYIYVMDAGAKAGAKASFVAYRRVDTVDTDYVTTKVTKLLTVSTDLVAGPTATCFAAANANFVFAGTDADTHAVRISKMDGTVDDIGGFSPPETVSSITTDESGDVAVTFTGGFYLFNQSGRPLEDGGGGEFIVGPNQGVPIN